MVEYKLTALEEGKIDDTVNEIVMFIDKQYESIGVKVIPINHLINLMKQNNNQTKYKNFSTF